MTLEPDKAVWRTASDEPVRETTVGSVLREAAATAGERLAIVAAGDGPGDRRTWTYSELLRDSERLARALLTRFEPGEHIAVYAPNVAEWVLLEFAAGLAGLVLVTVNPANRARELEYVLKQSRSVGVFHVASFRGNPLAQWIAEVRPALPGLREVFDFDRWQDFVAAGDTPRTLPVVSPDDPVQIQYTSGTTGNPKGALLHHRGLTNNARIFAGITGASDGDVYAHAMPFFHTGGCVLATLGAVQARATHAFLTAFDPGRLLELLEAERGTHMTGVPTMLIAMMEHPDFAKRDLSSLRVAMCGGANVPPEVVRAIESRLGVKFCIVYGQTECSPLITMTRPHDSPEDKAFTVGQPLPHAEVKVVAPGSGETVAFDEVGEICTRGPMVMHCYFDKPEATAAAIDAEGWLHTGDLGTMDARGYCRITGRLKDMVIRGGENLFPAEIESALIEHAAISDVAVIGVPDPRMGEELAAFVRTNGAWPPVEELRTHVRSRLAAPKTPRYWVFLDEFPLTGSGKIQKFVLRQRWDAGEFDFIDAAPKR